MMDVQMLIRAGVGPTQAKLFAAPIESALPAAGITTPARLAAFLGQCMVESSLLTVTEEDLYYRRPEWILKVFGDRVPGGLQQAAQLAEHPRELANTVYARTNGNSLPGDGWRYRGRGLIQITGRGRYKAAADRSGRPYLDEPDLVAQPADAALTAALYWHEIDGNRLADTWQLDEITRAVNGKKMLHADLRRQYSEQALRALQ